ncbi:MAG: S-layer homology domain-containing protein, partial [Oscillospiraceae bacterium]|nr:S-layer homology domain-containing protein [Oscillospiraceae bacterium]
IYQGLAANPDIGLVGSPATLPGSFGVGSVVNSEASGYVTAYGKDYFYGAVAGQPTLADLSGQQDVVYVGLGSAEEIEAAGGVQGKIALIQRGTLTFTEKCDNAAAAGAVGVLMFNNTNGAFAPSVESMIPLGTLTMEEGLEILANFPDGVNGTITIVNEFNTLAVSMAASSSWGSTADLRISPEISAPGEGVTSSIGFGDDASYESWSGTSMATPHVAAGLALIKQHVRTLFPEATASEVNELAYAFAMSTAHQVSGFVRQQGAGLMDVAAAVSTEVYLSVPGGTRPKLELDESEDGSFTFSFTVNNVGSSDRSYTIVPSVLTEKVFDYEYSGNSQIQNPETATVKLINGTVYDVTELCNITGPETVTVKAGQSVTVEMTIACTEKLMAYFAENCPSGMFLEGFIHLEETGAEAPIDLSIPFLGFVGDWDYASMLDRGYYWQEINGENNYQQLSTSKANTVGYMTDQVLGVNRYADMSGATYLADRNAISPNGDGVMDALTYIEFTLLRNPKTVKLYVQDANGKVLETLYDADYAFRKDYFSGTVNGGDTFSTLAFEYAAEELAENETVYLVLETWLDHEGYDPADNESGRWIIPVTKDLTAPAVKVVSGGIEIIDANYTAYYAVYADEEKTELLYETGVFAEARGVAEFYETDAETLYVVTADYAGNEQFYLVQNGAVIELDTEAFYHGREIIGLRSKNYVTGYYEFDWVSFQSELPGTVTDLDILPEDYFPEDYDVDLQDAAVGLDGTVYVNDMNDNLYRLEPGTLNRIKIAAFNVPGEEDLILNIKCIAVDPGSGQLYAYGSTFDPETWESLFYLFAVDVETGELTEVFAVDEMQYEVWALTFVDDGLLAIYNSAGNDFLTVDLEGNIVNYYSLGLYDDMGATYLAIYGYGGNMIYDPVANAVYLASDWSWFFPNRYSQGGMLKFDFDTETATMSLVGNYGGMVIHSMFFADEMAQVEPVELTDFSLDQTAAELQVGEGMSVSVITEPSDANRYSVEWTSSDETVATVAGGPNMANIYTYTEGTATITATAYDLEGNEIASRSLEVTSAYDEELLKALNVEGGELKFLTDEPYPFVPVMDEESGRYYAASTNGGVEGDVTYSVLTMTQALRVGDKISFDYFVSSEEWYDLFGLLVNGEQMLVGTGEVDWTNFVYTAEADGVYTFEWIYQKDFSVDGGLDMAGVDNVELIPTKRDDVIAMIDAIGEVTLDSGEAIAAARDAYEALTFMEKELIDNYQTLLDAEREYVRLLAAQAAVIEARYYALDIVEAMESTDTTGWCVYQTETLAEAIAAAKAAIEAAVSAEEIDAALTELYAVADALKGGCPSCDFADVSETAWYHKGVDFALAKGLMVGMSDTSFVPNGSVTRAQLVTILYRLAGKPSVEGLENPFEDVAEDAWYAEAVIWAANAGVVNGVSATTFAPNTAITREQIAAILYRYTGAEAVEEDCLKDFTDMDKISAYAVDAMNWAVSEGLINGMGDGTLAPGATATRAQIASIMMRYLTGAAG